MSSHRPLHRLPVRHVALAYVCAGALACTRSQAAPSAKVLVDGAKDPPAAWPSEAPASDGPLTDRDYLAGLKWRFRAGSPIGGAPVLSPDGTLYTGTTQGYVFALDGKGAFEWAYTVVGAVVGRPVVDDRGRVFVATTARRVYALNPNGTESWLFRCPVPVVAGLARGRDGDLFFGGADEHLWAISSRALALYRIALGAWITAGPTLDSGGDWVGFGTSDGRLVMSRSSRLVHELKLDEVALRATPIVRREDLAYAVATSGLVAVNPKSGEQRWARAGARHIALSGDSVVVATDQGDLEWVRPDGSLARSERLGVLASAAPAIGQDGTVYVPAEDGTLVVVAPNGRHESVPVAHAPLYEPLVTPRQIIASAGDGTIAGIRLSAGARQ
jgi:outer membrane protein assembly factor BamB